MRASIADANAPKAHVAVAVFNLLPLDMAFAVGRLIARLIIAWAAVIAAIGLRADDRADSQTADDAGCDCAAITGESGLRRGRYRQYQSGNRRNSNDLQHILSLRGLS